MKKGKRIAMDSSLPPPPLYSVAAGARLQLRYQSLFMDYQDLLKETEAKKRHLQKEHKKKLKLLAEVKFLRKKYEAFVKNPSRSTLYRVKKRQDTAMPHLISNAQPLEPIFQSQVSEKDRNPFCGEASIPSTSAGIDLNKVSLPNDYEMEGFQVNWEPLEVGNSKKRALEGDAFSNDLKLSIYQDVGKGSSRTKKKKITWRDPVALNIQDQVALKV